MSHITRRMDRARRITESRLMPDACVVSTPPSGPPIKDGKGGTLPGTPTTVTTVGRLRAVDSNAANEQAIVDRLSLQQPMAIDLPVGVVVQSDATITTDGRTFSVGGVAEEGVLARKQTVIVQESRR